MFVRSLNKLDTRLGVTLVRMWTSFISETRELLISVKFYIQIMHKKLSEEFNFELC
jgi:hypothetical protein